MPPELSEDAKVRRSILTHLKIVTTPQNPWLPYQSLHAVAKYAHRHVLNQLNILHSEKRVELRVINEHCMVRLTDLGRNNP